MKRNANRVAALAAAVCGLGLVFSQTHVAKATLLTGPVDTIYADNFTGTAGTAIVGNAPTTDTGLDGGTAGATWLGGAAGSGPDAVWQYSGSSSATINSPSANVVSGEDTQTINNIGLPIVPVLGYTYDLEATLNTPSATGGHGLEMAFLYNNANVNHISAEQAISNNDPAGLILDRDAVSGGGYFDVFEGTGTNGDTHFAPSATDLTSGTPGTTVTVDILYTPTSATSGTLSWYMNGFLATGSPVTVTGLTGGISYIQLGDNRAAVGTITNFSLTAVPEPASAALALIAGAPLLMRRRKS